MDDCSYSGTTPSALAQLVSLILMNHLHHSHPRRSQQWCCSATKLLDASGRLLGYGAASRHAGMVVVEEFGGRGKNTMRNESRCARGDALV